MIRDKSFVKTGGASKNLYNSLKRKNSRKNRTRKQTAGGCGCNSAVKTGGAVIKPAEFYGGNSGRYYATGAPELVPADSAYGKTRAVSFGQLADDMKTTGPNLGPYPNSSGMMTGGKRKYNKGKKGRKSTKSKKSKGKKRNSRSKRSSRK